MYVKIEHDITYYNVYTMETIINLMPMQLHVWAKQLKEADIAHILTVVGSISITDELKDEQLASANIGLAGEQEVSDILQDRYRVLNTAKSGKCGDIVITVNSIRILVEVKKYNKTVPSTEIEKFYRDIDSNSSIGGAILISLTSKIVGIRRNMEYTHQFVNGNIVPVIFLSLNDITDQTVAKECIYSAVDILLADIDSKSKYTDIGEDISHAIDDIDRNLDFLSQCRLMIHETQGMFNKQLGKLMQQVISAEINIKNSVRVIKSKIDIVEVKPNVECSIKDIISDLKIDLDTDNYNMLLKILDGRHIVVSKSGDTIQTKNKDLSVKLTKTNIKVSIAIILKNTIVINGIWTYNGKILVVELTEKTIQTILDLLVQQNDQGLLL